MLKPVREFFVKDGSVLHSWEYDTSWNRRRKTVYEVLRVINKIPLFEKEHTERLIGSALSTGFKNVLPGKINQSITKLIQANQGEDGNILCCIISVKETHHILSWFVEHHYPSRENYENGIILRTLKAIRKHPSAKVWNAELRNKAEYLINSSEAYEVLLVDKKKNVTEGSRSNIFLVRGDSVYTPPENKILKGITRQKIIEICKETGIQLIEKDIPLHEVPFYEAAFITGTSPGVLPVSAIDKHRFNISNDIIKKLMEAYNTIVREATISN